MGSGHLSRYIILQYLSPWSHFSGYMDSMMSARDDTVSNCGRPSQIVSTVYPWVHLTNCTEIAKSFFFFSSSCSCNGWRRYPLHAWWHLTRSEKPRPGRHFYCSVWHQIDDVTMSCSCLINPAKCEYTGHSTNTFFCYTDPWDWAPSWHSRSRPGVWHYVVRPRWSEY